jgi:hypothetical protein
MPASIRLSREDLESLPISFATPSLGFREPLENKISAMKDAGYKNVTLGFGNFMAWVRSQCPDL